MNLTESRQWMILALVVGAGWLIYLLAPILTPFAIAAFLAYLGDPITDWLQRRGMGRTIAVTVVFLTLTLVAVVVVVIAVPLLEDQFRKLVVTLPSFFEWAKTQLSPVVARLNEMGVETLDRERVLEMVQPHLQQATGLATIVLGSITRSGVAIFGWAMNLVLIPVVAFYMLRDWDVVVQRVRELLPRHLEPTVVKLTTDSNAVLGAFLRGQLTVMLALGVIYSTGLWLVGLDLAFLVGMLAGIISFVPYLGAIVGVGLGIVGALFQFGDVLHVLLVLAVFGVGQALEGMLLTPLLVGDKIGLHPVAVIFAVLAGGQLFGFLGVLLALPAASVIMVLLRYAHEQYKRSELYGKPLEVEIDPASAELEQDPSEQLADHSDPEQDPTA
ncbi:MAG: AI-2E family transporter [Xanthomonadales bacterium]|nr:AI-2E family transporter [Xanthomonadales bacterium]